MRFTSDKTPKQHEHFQNLRKELNERRSNGEPNLLIKYHKGIPPFPFKKTNKTHQLTNVLPECQNCSFKTKYSYT